jgi:hypothetical protein
MNRGAEPLVPAAVRLAAGCYVAGAALGLSVATGVVDTSRGRWLHHALFLATASTTTLALGLSAAHREPAALALAPAAIPLLLLPRRGAHPLPRHVRTAAAAAPCYAAALLLTRR